MRDIDIEIDIEIAQALGWVDIVVSDDTGRIRLPLDQWREQNPNAWPIYLTGRSPEVPDWPSSVVPHYGEDIDWLEDEVERRGLQEQYVKALARICEVARAYSSAWALMRATPDQRVQAFLKALKP